MAETRREIDTLAARFGAPLVIDSVIPDHFDDPIRKPDRYGEVCMVVRRPNGTVLLSIKTFYPRGAYRLPTGGIHRGEPILDALLRETNEETGLQTDVRRFLARIAYHSVDAPTGVPIFHTFAFLLDETAERLARSTRPSRSRIGVRSRSRSSRASPASSTISGRRVRWKSAATGGPGGSSVPWCIAPWRRRSRSKNRGIAGGSPPAMT
jgi:8-oxo-dGTP pyrophosphatase MutT (NUDIX family)